MASKDPEVHYHELAYHGFTVYEKILPASLITDLRREVEKGVEEVRKQKGPQAQRFQPFSQYAHVMDLKPFEDYRDLPELNDILKKTLTPEHDYGDLDRAGVLLEPAELPWCTNWHRDFRDHIPLAVFEDAFAEEWDAMAKDVNYCLQINCALYEDQSTWFVPDSHIRQKNSAEEERLRDSCPDLEGLSAVERESRCLEYAKAMPGAVQLRLHPGDFALYRPCAWHMGNYVPYKKRATLHDSLYPGDINAFVAEQSRRVSESKKRLGL